MKLLTIAIPAYNVEIYLSHCLHSLIKVTSQDKLEILIINDGSTDKTASIAKRFAEKYPDLITLINKENGGHGSAINTALSVASGKYFMVLDGDDQVNSDALDTFISTIEDVDVDLISTNYERINIQTGAVDPVIQQNICYNRIYSFEELNVNHIYFALASSCFRTELLIKNKIILQENTFYVDVEYILLPIPFIQSVIFYDLYVYRYYVGNSQQSIHIPTMVKRYSHHERVLKRVICYFQNQQLTGNQKAYIKNIMKKLLYTHYSLALIYNPDKFLGYEQAKNFDLFLQAQSKDLYILAGKTIPFLYIARKYQYNYEKYQKSFFYCLKESPCYSFLKTTFFKLKLNRLCGLFWK